MKSNTEKETIIITGSAGFIGFHLCKRLLTEGYTIASIDNLNDYYDVGLKADRLKILQSYKNFQFIEGDLTDSQKIDNLFNQYKPELVVHLGAQAGVRYSLINPHAYINSNISGFLNVLEGCRNNGIKNLVYGSSSSVYGANSKVPFSEDDSVNEPVSFYSVTKRTNELMAYTYSNLYGLHSVGLRFFTVYGPWGRPDMAYFSFTKKILAGESINVYNNGKMFRAFTYIDDVVESIMRLIQIQDLNNVGPPNKIYNIGNNTPVELNELIGILETALNRKAIRNELPAQPGDMLITFADIDKLYSITGFQPKTTLKEGLNNFVNWYLQYYEYQLNAK